ncbi:MULTISPECIES: rhodanese-like domain-containing protein [Thioclava]|uniref:Sulfurtransferase n=1 Tax=Thioclava nitratireducens TaxID=1915078 RepID=A0ABM6IJI8_9RHOB|nr:MULTISPECIES: rhodanese-like domain-containing protein [Thioclava]AQS49012.1 sulfurtransferase [Thioclava nitratireducens]OWY01623.1 sulfurtransferase [Thioclava sp. F1Mire-8]OWY02935.1 sulfurtransferase [Thioclava sp. IC9]OWY09931.1 sulfurtransferase [Thioclava sp. F42-5]OWY14776.1 sulfurtransferase [Thioclava sp. F34-6]
MRFMFLAALLVAAPVLTAPAFAEPVNIRPDVMSVTVETAKGPVEIKRIQDNENKLEGEWAKTSRPCPNFCIQPMIPAPGVTPVGELEMMEFLKDPNVVVVDGRVTRDFEGGAIPGAINIPYMEAPDRLGELGCQPDFEGFICDGPDVKSVALYCNGPWCGQSPTAARRMIEAGFPAEKIYYYRGGMQQWRLLGLTVSGG